MDNVMSAIIPNSENLKLKMGFLSAFPAAQRSMKLRKSRSKMVLEALTKDVARGNVGVRKSNTDPWVVFFTYRGTDIMAWHIGNDMVTDVHAEDFEHTPSTFNQRKLAREAIDELRKAVGSL